MIEILVLVIILGVIAWGVNAIPMPQPFKVVAWVIMILILIFALAAFIGHPVAFPK